MRGVKLIEGIILAGGMSRRAGGNKLLWSVGDHTLIEHAVYGMRPYVDKIVVVTGAYHEALSKQLSQWEDVTIVYNEQHPLGMFTSVKKGLSANQLDYHAIILPADCPWVQASTYEVMIQPRPMMAVPTYQGRRGHPIFVPSHLKQALLNEPNTTNLKQFRNTHGFLEIKTKEPYITTDIDTAEDFEKVLRAIRKDDNF